MPNSPRELGRSGCGSEGRASTGLGSDGRGNGTRRTEVDVVDEPAVGFGPSPEPDEPDADEEGGETKPKPGTAEEKLVVEEPLGDTDAARSLRLTCGADGSSSSSTMAAPGVSRLRKYAATSATTPERP